MALLFSKQWNLITDANFWSTRGLQKPSYPIGQTSGIYSPEGVGGYEHDTEDTGENGSVERILEFWRNGSDSNI